MSVALPATGMVESRSPQDPEDVVALVATTDAAAVAAAADRGAEVQQAWWSAGAGARSRALAAFAARLRDRFEEACELVVREVGKPATEAAAEVTRAVSILDYYAQQSFAAHGHVLPPSAAGMLWTERRPHGVAGLVTPWNFPIAIPLWKAAPALAAGNAVLLKPSPQATACAQWLAGLADQALPPGLLQVLPGGADTGAALVNTADVVSFTGSAAVGHEVAVDATRRGVPVQAEMGGQNAAIVLPDADAEVTAQMIVSAAMGYAGQKCTATRRVVLVGGERRRQQVADALVAAVEALVVGDPARDDVALGPVIDEAARDRVEEAHSGVGAAGGRILGRAHVSYDRGWYVSPVVADGIDPRHPLAQEELFGPFLIAFGAATLDEAVTVAEGVRYGLVTSVHGRDSAQLLDAAARVGTGLVKVNAPTTGVDFYAPFGGERSSSIGPREQGLAALDFYSSTRTVTFAPHA